MQKNNTARFVSNVNVDMKYDFPLLMIGVSVSLPQQKVNVQYVAQSTHHIEKSFSVSFHKALSIALRKMG